MKTVWIERVTSWRPSAQQRLRFFAWCRFTKRAFTRHPEQTGESYLEHLWFTLTMSGRFIYTTVVLTIHGLFPFLLTTAASKQIEQVYRIMKMRIPKAQRDIIDADYSV